MTNKILYKSSITLKELILAIDVGGEGYVALVDESNKLIGLLTDGDLRRSILNDASIHDAINFNPQTISKDNYSDNDLISEFKLRHMRILPVVDSDNRLIKVFTDQNLNINIVKDFIVVIMAGGLGTRLGNLTKSVPKPMLKIAGKPILENVIINFKNSGLKKFLISVNYLSEQIIDYFGDGKNFGVDIDYVVEKDRLGTAGSLSLMKDLVDVDNTFIGQVL